MNAQPYPYQNRRPRPQNDVWVDFAFKGLLIFFLGALGLLLLPAVVVGAVAAVLVGMLRLKWWTLLVAALVVFGIFTSLDAHPIKRAEKVFRRSQNVWSSGSANPFEKLWKRGDKLWRLGLPATIPLGLALGAFGLAFLQRPTQWWDPNGDAQKAQETTSQRVKAAKRVRKSPDEIRGRAVLGAAAAGDLPPQWIARKPFGQPFLVYDQANLGRHIAVIGQPGSGKTVTLMRLAYIAAKVYGWRVYFLDGKGDYSTQREFIATMLDAGIGEDEIGAFPDQPFDGWKTTGSLEDGFAQLLNRLLGVVQFTEPYYEDATRSFLAQGLLLDGSLPGSSAELLERLESLVKASATEQRREAMGVLLRYRAFFDSFRGKLDGSWSFEDKRAAYVLLEGLAQPKEAGKLASYLFESFKHFAAHAKPHNEKVLLIVDEFPAIQADADAAGLVERLRSFGCSVALSAQSFDGLGKGKQRIISAARSLILHSCPEAEEVIRLAGTVQAYAVTTQIDSELGPTGRGSATPEQRFRVDPNLLGSLGEGEAFVVSQRRAQLVRVARNPLSDGVWARTTGVLQPKTQVERLEPPSVSPSNQTEHKRAIDW